MVITDLIEPDWHATTRLEYYTKLTHYCPIGLHAVHVETYIVAKRVRHMGTENPVVIDLGSESIKAGYASHVPSEHEPRIITPSLVTVHTSRHAHHAQLAASTSGRHHRVIDRGFIANWDYLESMLHYLLYEQLGWIKGEEGSALFVEPLFVGKSEREQLVQLMFEGFNVAGMFVHDAAVSSLFAAGKLSGCNVDIGHGKIDIATVSEGTTNAPGAARMSFAGEQLTELLGQLLQQRQGLQLQPQQLSALKVQCCRSAASAEAFRQLMKSSSSSRQQQQALTDSSSQQAAAAAMDAPQQQDQQQAGTSSSSQQQHQQQPLGAPEEFTLPDGTKITVTTEGQQIAEALFNPTILGHYTPGLVDCILESLNDHPDPSLKRSILENVLICGGGSCIPGIGERVMQDMRAQLPTSLVPTLCQLPEYMLLQSAQYVPWVGGAVMAKLVAHQSHFMIKAEYEEIGPSAVHRKCA